MTNYDLNKFTCKLCGNCCKGGGFVKILNEDIVNIAKFLNTTENEFLKKYTRTGIFGDIYLIDKPNKECIFLDKNKCSINEAKPLQCRNFPHEWRNADTHSTCAGINEIINKGI